MVQVVLDFELISKGKIVRIYTARRCCKSRISIFFGPLVENACKEGGMSLSNLFVIGFDDILLIKIIFDCISKDKQININPFQLLNGK